MLKSGNDPRYKYVETNQWEVRGYTTNSAYEYACLIGHVTATSLSDAMSKARVQWRNKYKSYEVKQVVKRIPR